MGSCCRRWCGNLLGKSAPVSHYGSRKVRWGRDLIDPTYHSPLPECCPPLPVLGAAVMSTSLSLHSCLECTLSFRSFFVLEIEFGVLLEQILEHVCIMIIFPLLGNSNRVVRYGFSWSI